MKDLYFRRLTDKDIFEMSGDNVITEVRDFNLKLDKQVKSNSRRMYPYRNGLYDDRIFGSLNYNKCMCERTNKLDTICPICQSEVISDEKKYFRYARIESPVYYLKSMTLGPFIGFLGKSFLSVTLNISDVKAKHITQKHLDIYQMNYNEEEDTLIITDEIDDFMKCSYEGIIKIFTEHKPEKLDELYTWINHYILVTPPITRPHKYKWNGISSELSIPIQTALYQGIIANIRYFSRLIEGFTDEVEIAYARGVIRKIITENLISYNSILYSSKANSVRNTYGKRISNSGRAPIVADPTLRVDQVGIPEHMLHEILRRDFIKYMIDSYQMTNLSALNSYENMDEFTKSEFLSYARRRKVILNRAPTLHEYNILALDIVPNSDYTIGLPILLCSPFNADFDGDTMSFYLIPEDLPESEIEKSSPRNMLVYRKNLKPLFTPNHEVLTGLYLASKIKVYDNTESFDTWEDAKQFSSEFKKNRLYIIGGDKATTYARYQISQILEADLDNVLLKDGELINGKTILNIMVHLEKFEDRIQKIKDLQDFALEFGTLYGMSTLTYSDIYRDMESDKLMKIKELLESKEKGYLAKVEELYRDYLSDLKESLSDKIKMKFESSDRLKMSSLMAILSPQLYINTEGEAYLTDTTLMKGMSYDDYVNHSIENRLIQDIKKFGVPLSGYLTRQVVHAGEQYIYSDSLDAENEGILIPVSVAEGRVDMNGNRIGKLTGGGFIRVKSVISSNLVNTITSDCLNPRLKYVDGSNIGLSFTTSTTEALTQSALSLKHGGSLLSVPDEGILYSHVDGCRISDDGSFLTYGNGIDDRRIPLPENFVYDSDRTYAKDEILGYCNKVVNPAYNLDACIKLLSASGVGGSRKHEKSTVLFSDCYSVSEGKIVYVDNRTMKIGDVTYYLNPNCLAYFSEGEYVNKYTRISSGVQKLSAIISKTNSIEEQYIIFRYQFRELMGNLTEELIEFLFKIITQKSGDSFNKFLGINRASNSTEAFMKGLGFQGASRKIVTALKAEKVPVGETPLSSLLLNNFLSTDD